MGVHSTVHKTHLVFWFFKEEGSKLHVKGTCVKKKLEIEQENCY